MESGKTVILEGITLKNAQVGSTNEGGGVYIDNGGTLIMQGSSTITDCKAGDGGVYVNGTRIAINNDVYLDSNSWINVADTLTAEAPVARITVPNNEYQTTTKVLDGNAALLNSQHAKFAVTPKGDEYWTVGSDGRLTKDKTAVFNNITMDQRIFYEL